MNPTVIIEILSPTTESYDRGLKFQRYQRIASLREYVLISQMPCRLEIYRRAEDKANASEWRYISLDDCDAIVSLSALGISFPLSEVYEGVAAPSGDISGFPEPRIDRPGQGSYDAPGIGEREAMSDE